MFRVRKKLLIPPMVAKPLDPLYESVARAGPDILEKDDSKYLAFLKPRTNLKAMSALGRVRSKPWQQRA